MRYGLHSTLWKGNGYRKISPIPCNIQFGFINFDIQLPSKAGFLVLLVPQQYLFKLFTKINLPKGSAYGKNTALKRLALPVYLPVASNYTIRWTYKLGQASATFHTSSFPGGASPSQFPVEQTRSSAPKCLQIRRFWPPRVSRKLLPQMPSHVGKSEKQKGASKICFGWRLSVRFAQPSSELQKPSLLRLPVRRSRPLHASKPLPCNKRHSLTWGRVKGLTCAHLQPETKTQAFSEVHLDPKAPVATRSVSRSALFEPHAFFDDPVLQWHFLSWPKSNKTGTTIHYIECLSEKNFTTHQISNLKVGTWLQHPTHALCGSTILNRTQNMKHTFCNPSFLH